MTTAWKNHPAYRMGEMVYHIHSYRTGMVTGWSYSDGRYEYQVEWEDTHTGGMYYGEVLRPVVRASRKG